MKEILVKDIIRECNASLIFGDENLKIENFSKDSLEKESLTKKKNKTKKSVEKKSKVENQVEKFRIGRNLYGGLQQFRIFPLKRL